MPMDAKRRAQKTIRRSKSNGFIVASSLNTSGRRGKGELSSESLMTDFRDTPCDWGEFVAPFTGGEITGQDYNRTVERARSASARFCRSRRARRLVAGQPRLTNERRVDPPATGRSPPP